MSRLPPKLLISLQYIITEKCPLTFYKPNSLTDLACKNPKLTYSKFVKHKAVSKLHPLHGCLMTFIVQADNARAMRTIIKKVAYMGKILSSTYLYLIA